MLHSSWDQTDHMAKKCWTFDARRFIILSAKSYYWSLSRARWIQSTFMLICFPLIRICMDFPSGVFPFCFLTDGFLQIFLLSHTGYIYLSSLPYWFQSISVRQLSLNHYLHKHRLKNTQNAGTEKIATMCLVRAVKSQTLQRGKRAFSPIAYAVPLLLPWN
jgi:hypothetical protein